MSLIAAPKIVPARFVTIDLAAIMTGYTTSAIRTKIARGVWAEGREWVYSPDNRVLIDMEGYSKWAGKATAWK